jgi:anti-anti-sigma factor
MREPPLTQGLRTGVSALGATSTIGLEGAWDLAGESAASRAIAKTLERSPERLVLDLSQLAFMDASGVQAAIQLSARSHAENFQLAIVPGPRAVQRVFDICHVTEALPFVASAWSWGIFSLHNARVALAVNWGLAAVLYLIVGGLIPRLFTSRR